ncbi:MAG: hypothetical protein CSA73_01180 [Rhodobacterales bacterium]|nr:MAG: hypothetical protein CSA73_01180 [Rhodobacterales bacterium]
MKKTYGVHARISQKKSRAALRCFSTVLTTLQAAGQAGTPRNAINRIHHRLRPEGPDIPEG